MPRKSLGKQRRSSFVGPAVFLWIIFSLGSEARLCRAEEKNSDTKQAMTSEREKAIEEGVLKAKEKTPMEVIPAEKEKKAAKEEAAKKTENKEKPPFFLAESIRWEVGQDKALLEIRGEDGTLPSGAVDASPNGIIVRWRPEQTLVAMKKKDNSVESPFLQRVIFKEDAEMTKKLGLEAPYYALSEVILIFSSSASYKLMQEGGWLSLEFSLLKKPVVPADMEALVRQQVEIPMPKTSSPAEILGENFQAKELFETYMLGGGQARNVLEKRRAQNRPSEGIFNGQGGFPEDVTPVLKEAYPVFGTQEYWKRHIRGALGQTFGYSSDFDGIYGAGENSTKDKAFTLQPDVNIDYNGLGFGRPLYGTKTPTGSVDLGYSARRMLPLGSRDLHFGDGARLQTIKWGGTYSPQKRYSLSCQNQIGLFASKTLGQSGGDWVREPRRGYRMTNALGLNYRLTRKILWRNGIGLSGTRSIAPDGVSRDLSGYLNTGFTQAISRRLKLDTDYSYRHLYYDEDPFDDPSPNTKGKDIHSMTMDVGYRISKKLTFSGGPELDVIDGPHPYGNIFGFGGRSRLQYRWTPRDSFNAVYGNGMIEDGTGKIMSGLLGRNLRDTKINLRRGTRTGISYTRELQSGSLSFSFDYRRILPLDGIFPRELQKIDMTAFQVSWHRRLRGGRSWLELIYRYTNWRSRGIDPRDENTDSANEHAVLLTFGSYFGA